MIKLDNGKDYLWQWDLGRRVQLQGVPVNAKIHFSTNCDTADAYVVPSYVDEDGNVYADIPNTLLQTFGCLTAYVYQEAGQAGTCHDSKRFMIREREKPADYVYTDDEAKTWEALDERIKALEENGGGGVSPDELTAAVEAALTDAKESGLFDGAPGDDYVLTEQDKEEIAQKVGAPGATVEPADDDIPKVFFTGDTAAMSKSNAVDLGFEYRSKSAVYSGTASVKWQGSSSISFPEKNYTIKLYEDPEKTQKLYLDIKGWGRQNKFCLKANYTDTLHLRNIVGARIAYDMITSRADFDAIPTELREAPRCGVIDGFPVKVFINGILQGIYTWNIPKDKWMMNMDDSNANHALLMAEKNNNGSANPDALVLACEFRANATIFADTSTEQYPPYDWIVEGPGEDVNGGIRQSFNALIDCVKGTDDETFRATIGDHLDLTSAFDYYCFAYLLCHVDGLGKNLGMATYDGVKWYCILYDMDALFGANIDGTTFYEINRKCPEQYQETNSLLWQRIENCFGKELYARYLELRGGALSIANIITHAERFYDGIPNNYYDEDQSIWTGKPSRSTNTVSRLRSYMVERAEYVDGEMLVIGTAESGEVEPEPETPSEYALTSGKGINFTNGELKAASSEQTKALEAYHPVKPNHIYYISIPDGYGWMIAYDASFNFHGVLLYDSGGSKTMEVAVLDANIAYIRWGCHGGSGVTKSTVEAVKIESEGGKTLISLDASGLDTSAGKWTDESGIVFNLSGTPTADANGLDLTSCEMSSSETIKLQGEFTVHIELCCDESALTAAYTGMFFGMHDGSKYVYGADIVNGQLRINCYAGNTQTKIPFTSNVLTDIAIVRTPTGTAVYKDGEAQGEFAVGNFGGVGDYFIRMSNTRDIAHFSIKSLKIYDYALTADEVAALSET